MAADAAKMLCASGTLTRSLHSCFMVTPLVFAIQPICLCCLQVVLASHLGRPNPAKQSWDEMERDASLAPVAAVLEDLLPQGSFTGLAPDCVGERAEAAVNALQPGQVGSIQHMSCCAYHLC